MDSPLTLLSFRINGEKMLQENMPERFEENLFGEIKLLLLLRLAQILRLVPEELSVQVAVLVDL